MTYPVQMRTPRGSALVVAFAFVFVLAAFLVALVQGVMSENMGTDSMVQDARARYLAESGAEYACQQLKMTIANNYPMLTTGTGIVLTGYVPGYDQSVAGLPVIRWKAIRIQATGTNSTGPGGITQWDQLYQVTGRAVITDPDEPTRFNEAFVNKMLDLNSIPLFQYLAFYNQFDLEMLPGNTANLKGRIQSNRSIWIGTQPGNTLTIDTESMKSAGLIQRQRKDDPASASDHYMTGTVQIKVAGAPETPVNSTNYPTMAARGTLKTASGALVPTSAAPSGFDSNFMGYDVNGDGNYASPNDLAPFAQSSQTLWNGGVQTSAQNVPQLAAPTDIRAFRPPLAGETPTYAKNASNQWAKTGSGATSVPGFYMSQANLAVASNGSTTQLILNPIIAPTTVFQMTNGSVTTNLLKNSSGAAVVPLSDKAMFDGREYDPSTDTTAQSGTTGVGMVKVTEIDMAKLNTALYNGSPVLPTTGTGSVVVAYRTDATSTNPNGIRLTNGSTVNNNMTFVSEDPVYVKGDFNTVNEKGVVIMADAVNLLSNQWNDSMTANSGLPVPTSPLNFNAAVMTGAYPTIAPDANGNGGVYNGGFENFPRFHEDWSRAGSNSSANAVNINGSFVSLFTSTYAKGNWVYGGNVYTAPIRNWNFDPNFLKSNFQPPGFPVSVGETRVVWWRGRQSQYWTQFWPAGVD